MSEFKYIDMDEQLSDTSTSPYIDYDYDIDNATSLVPVPNAIDLGHNADGSKKYSFDTIYQDKELIENEIGRASCRERV